jgi:hypothetical protein
MNVENSWSVYRTRFLVQARQLTAPLVFTDALGREHSGQAGDYLVEFQEGVRRITPREAFEDIYVPLESTGSFQNRQMQQARPPVSVPQSPDPRNHIRIEAAG